MATDIVLRNRDGDKVIYYGIETVTFDTPEDAAQATFTLGVEETDKEVELNFETGDQTVTADDGYLWKELSIKVPDGLASENIRYGVTIAGVEGNLIGDTEEVTVGSTEDGDTYDLDFSEADEVTVEPSEDTKVLSKVTVKKPANLSPENIASGVEIAGVTGTHEGSGSSGGSSSGGSSSGDSSSSDSDLEEIDALVDEINGEIVNPCYVTFIGADGSTLCTVAVAPGYDCDNPVSSGLISKPTKESSAEYTYTFAGWSLTEDGTASSSALTNVTEDRTVYAVFTASTRYYTVKFYDGTTLVNTESVAYGGSSDYTYDKTGAYFQGWTPEPTNITSDTACYGEWVYASFAADDWATIAAHAQAGVANEYYDVGDERTVQVTIDGSTQTIILQIAKLNTSEVTKYDDETTGTAGMILIAKNPLEGSSMPYSTTETSSGADVWTVGGFNASDILTYLTDTVLPGLPSELSAVIPYTQKKYSYYNYSSTIPDTNNYFKLWIPSTSEVYAASDHHGSVYYPAVFTDPSVAIPSVSDEASEFRVRTLYGSDTGVKWWLRTIDGRNEAFAVDVDGSIITETVYSTDDAPYVLFGFAL